jgi:DNA replication protein DnaC
MKAYEQTLSYLKTLSLQGIVQGLDELINDAESRKSSYLAFLNAIFSAEIDFRIKRRVERNMTGAHFPVEKKLDNFDFGRVKGLGKSEAVNLLDCR